MNSGKKINEIINNGYSLGMAQIREEITGLAYFLQGKDINNFLEIGTKMAGTFSVLSALSRSGVHISVDMVSDTWGGWFLKEHPYLGKTLEKRNIYIQQKLLGKTVMGNSHSPATYDRVVDILGKDERLDLLFIDGDHSYEGVKRDYYEYKSLVRVGGYIIFHDINDTEHHRNAGVHVGRFWNELEGDKIEFNSHAHWAGIGVLINE